MRQAREVAVPSGAVRLAASRPRGALWLSLLPPFWLCPMLRTSTDTTLSAPGRSSPDGRPNVRDEFWLPPAVPVDTVPSWVPLTHTAHTPARPVPAVSASVDSAPVAVTCPRYHTSP